MDGSPTRDDCDTSLGLSFDVGGGPACMDMREAIVLATQLVSILIVVTVLSTGLVLCAAVFVWCCFLYPSACPVVLPILGGGIGTVAVVYGRRVLGGLTKRYAAKLVKHIEPIDSPGPKS